MNKYIALLIKVMQEEHSYKVGKMKCDICKEELDEEYLEFHCADGTSLNVCFDCMVCYPNVVNDRLDEINKHLRS